MVIKIELNFKLRKPTVKIRRQNSPSVIKKDRSADPGTVRATKK